MIETSSAVGIAMSIKRIGVVRTNGLAKLSNVGSCSAGSLASLNTHLIIPKIRIRTHSYTIPGNRIRKRTSRTSAHASRRRIITISIRVATGWHHTVVESISKVPNRTHLHASEVVLEERSATGFAHSVSWVSVLVVAADGSAVVICCVAIEIRI